MVQFQKVLMGKISTALPEKRAAVGEMLRYGLCEGSPGASGMRKLH